MIPPQEGIFKYNAENLAIIVQLFGYLGK